MSEDEQSWSYNDSRDNLRRGRLLVCAMAALKPQERWPMDNRSFSQAVDKLAAEGNSIATNIHVYHGLSGRHCPDFKEMLSFARSSGLIDYLSSYQQLVLNVGGRALREHLEDFDEKEVEAAKALAQGYWNEVYGEPRTA